MTERRAVAKVHGPLCVDPCDQHLLIEKTWHRNASGYAAHSRGWRINGKQHHIIVTLHRMIVGAQSGEFVDHINRNILDNRRANLRLCTKAENNRNMVRARRSESGFRGVTKKGHNKYYAQIRANHKRLYLGVYDTAKEAAAAYDQAAIYHHGDFAVLNVPTVREDA